MEYGFLSRAGRFLQEQKKHRRWMMIFLCLAGGVTLGTLGFLKLYGQAMTHKVKLLDCQYEVHVHTEDCWEEDEEGNEFLVCEHADEAEYVIHVHNDDCYDSKGELVCPLEEHELHEHDEDCWEEEKVLICGLEETEGGAAEAPADTITEETAQDAEAPEQTADDGSQDQAQEPVCGKEVHKHDESCYADGTGCEKEEHTHGEGCYQVTEVLDCGTEEHSHDDSCYTIVEGDLICGEEEHSHDDGCYDEEGNVVCGFEEHTHDEDCHESVTELTCGQEEHEHDDSCYRIEKELICTTEEHEHDDSCAAESELICGFEEHEHDESCYPEAAVTAASEEAEAEVTEVQEEETTAEATEMQEEETAAEEGHIHTDECYETKLVLTCGELELHTHETDPDSEDCCYDEDCYDEDGEFIEGSRPSCGLLQLEEHVHTEECFRIVEMTAEEIAAINGGATLHVHTEECYDEEGNLICGHEVTHLHQLDCYDEDGNLICGFGGEVHQHDANCYDEEGNRICNYENAKDHEHDGGCYDEEGNLTCGYQGVREHEHTKACYDEEGNLTCGYEGVKDHEHDAGCYDIFGDLICGYEDAADHVHTEACYDEEGNLICGREVLETYEQSRRFESDNYIVVTRYNDDAEIPEEAELLVEQITPESDGEHYANREMEYRETVGDENASMKALLKIGFYVEGEEGQTEVEPKTPILVAVQFLDEEGLVEGKPIRIVHFAEDGTEALNGSEAKDNSTTFTIDSFSEIAFGELETEDVDQPLQLNYTFPYTAEPFQITFHIEGTPKDQNGETVMIANPAVPEEGTDAVMQNGETPELQDGVSPTGSDPAAEQDSDASGSQNGERTDSQPDAEAQQDDGALMSQNEEISGADKASVETGQDTDQISPEEESQPPFSDGSTEEDWKEGNVPEIEGLQFQVKLLEDNSDIHAQIVEYLGDPAGMTALRVIQSLSYEMTYQGQKLDLSDCIVTVKIAPQKALFDEADKIAEEQRTGSEETEEQETGEPETEGPEAEGPETEMGITVTVYEITESNAVQKLGEAYLDKEEPDPSMIVQMSSDTMVITRDVDPNPKFTVQYYAYVQTLAEGEEYKNVPTEGTIEDIMAIKLADTSGKKLPENVSDGDMPKKYLYAKLAKGEHYTTSKNNAAGEWKVYEPLYDDILTQLYKDEPLKFERFCYLNTFNKFADEETNFELSEIWVLKEGKDPKSTVEDDWTIYKSEDYEDIGAAIGITNNPEVTDENVIVIEKGTVIRLVGRSKEGSFSDNAIFYDYDISDGKAYGKFDEWAPDGDGKNKTLYDEVRYDLLPGLPGSKHSKVWMWVDRKGINSESNYSNVEAGNINRFAFGNSNTGGTGWQEAKLKDVDDDDEKWYINQANTDVFGKCSFGIVKNELGSDGYPEFNMPAPDLYSDEWAFGKTQGPPFSLQFNRVGDTYTLSSVEGSKVKNLDKFQYAGTAFESTVPIWCNQFWPMDDSSATYGTEGHDFTFGDKKYYGNGDNGTRKSVGSGTGNGRTRSLPMSDDGNDHNSYFSMQFAIEFQLTEDYCGPLEYCFFGDDDMWVFLDNDLVCDIGGVHQAAGEYVNLWDWVEEGDTKPHTLKFFYNERGASGSTCWMHFTLPSVHAVPCQYPTGDFNQTLTVNKSVSGAVTNEGFKFEVRLYNSDGTTELNNLYSYDIKDKDGKAVTAGSIRSGGTFVLKDGQSISVRNLPEGARYEIKETKRDDYVSEINGVIEEDGTVQGSISAGGQETVNYVNLALYELPRTGGPGPIWYMIAGAFLITLGAGLMYNKKFSERRV